MRLISILLARLSLVQAVVLALLFLALSLAYGTRPLASVGSADTALQNASPTLNSLELANLTEAVESLKSAGFVRILESREERTFASSSFRSDDTSALLMDAVNLPRVIAIVKARGEFEAYLRQGESLQVVGVGDTAGEWLIDEISLGELRLSRAGVQEVIDVFGADTTIESQE